MTKKHAVVHKQAANKRNRVRGMTHDRLRKEGAKEEVRLYLKKASQCAINAAAQVKEARAELLYPQIDMEPGASPCSTDDRNVRLFCRVTAEAVLETGRTVPICGLAVFRSKALLPAGAAIRKNIPGRLRAVLRDGCSARELPLELPPFILDCFDNKLYFGGEGKQVYLVSDNLSYILS